MVFDGTVGESAVGVEMSTLRTGIRERGGVLVGERAFDGVTLRLGVFTPPARSPSTRGRGEKPLLLGEGSEIEGSAPETTSRETKASHELLWA